jgi:acetyl esterase
MEPIQEIYTVIKKEELPCQIRLPDNTKTQRPCIVLFHGGGWSKRNMSQFRKMAEYFTSIGYVTCVPYGVNTKPGDSIAAPINSQIAAIRYMREHYERLGLDRFNIIALGGSAGGHGALAVNLLTTQEYVRPSDTQDGTSAMVLLNPVVDFGGPGSHPFDRRRTGKNFKPFSPIHNVREGAPPTLLYNGTNDKRTPHRHAVKFKAAMEAVGSTCDLVIVKGAVHAWFNKQPHHDNIMRAIGEWLIEQKLDPDSYDPEIVNAD